MYIQITHSVDVCDIAEALAETPEANMRHFGRQLANAMEMECSVKCTKAFLDGFTEEFEEANADLLAKRPPDASDGA